MRDTLDPKNDIVFHMLFAHPESKGCLISLLTAVLRPSVPIVDLEVLNPDIPKEQISDKGIVLDILVRLADGSMVDVEMQIRRRAAFRKRVLFYWARTFSSQIGRGEEYGALRPTAVVVFTDYREREAKRLHSNYRLLEVHDYEELSRDLEIHLVELPKLKGLAKTDRDAEAALVRWARFLTAETDPEPAEAAKEDKMVDELAETNKMIEQAKDILERLSADPKVQQMVRMREEGEFLYRVDLTEARKEGIAEGEARGKRKVLFMLLDRAGFSLTSEHRQEIESCVDISRLDQWIEHALSGDFNELIEADFS